MRSWKPFAVAAAALTVGQTVVVESRPGFVFEDLGEGVYVVRDAAGSLAKPVHGSVVSIVGDEDVIVVDSSRTASAARIALRFLADVTGKPVRALVNTHWHEDHVMMNFFVRPVLTRAYEGPLRSPSTVEQIRAPTG